MSLDAIARISRRVAWPIAATICACAGSTAPRPLVLERPAGVRELNADEQVKQALSRLTFGIRPGDYARVEAIGLDQWLGRQLEPDGIANQRADSVLALLAVEGRSPSELAAAYPPQDLFLRFVRREHGLADNAPYVMTADDSARFKSINDAGNRLGQEVLTAKLLRDATSERQLLEVMTDFWENHFSVYVGKMPTRFTLASYDRDVIRAHALGKFRDLLGAVAHSPAMLYYLDNWNSQSDTAHETLGEMQRIAKARSSAQVEQIRAAGKQRRQGVNENYARELMELHTLGVDGGYSQRDVQEVARALTGWTIDNPRMGGGFVFRPEWHDAGVKHVLGQTLARGRGEEDGEEVLDILARHPSTARFIATKLARHFVSDAPPPTLIARLADRFRETDGDIRQVMAALVTSPELYSRQAYRAKVKTPYELVVSTMRAMEALPDTAPRGAQLSSQLGQPMFGRLTPDGWPEIAVSWLNSGAIIQRINFGVAAVSGRVPGLSLDRWSPTAQLRRQPYAEQVEGVIDAVLAGEASQETRGILLDGRNPLIGDEARMNVTPSGKPPAVPFAQLVGLALGAPEFQRR
jgi:uncharacterized protein (DUF1800 family)